VLDDLMGFDWDVHNVGQVAAHEVMPEEVEEAVRETSCHHSGGGQGGREALEVVRQVSTVTA